MSESVNKRIYGIEFLRILLMFSVCFLHSVSQCGAMKNASDAISRNTILLFEKIAYCAVDGFAIISGYCARNTKRDRSKIVKFWFQAFFYSFIVSLVLYGIGVGRSSFSVKELIKAAFPVTFDAFWYFTSFFVLWLVEPVINKGFAEINKDKAAKLFVAIFVFSTAMGIVADPFRTQNGYSPIWLIVLYIVGVLVKRAELFQKKRNITLVIMLVLCFGINWLETVFFHTSYLTSYVSPTVVLEAVLFVVLFARIERGNKVIRSIAPCVFGIYLLQTNKVLWTFLLKDLFVVNIGNVALEILIAFGGALAIFVCGFIVELIRAKIEMILKMDFFYKKIAMLIGRLIERIAKNVG